MDILERLLGDYFWGVVDVVREGDGVVLKRVTDGQMGHYALNVYRALKK